MALRMTARINDPAKLHSTALIAGLLLVLTWGVPSWGGPAKYDAATRSFSLTYTYAVVPSAGMSPDQLDQLGAVVNDPNTITTDMDAKIRAIFEDVSKKLSQATNSRAKIGKLDHVDNVKAADIIISPSGKIGRGGYAQLGAIEGQQGHLVISYGDLGDESDTDVSLTVFHELSHYLFGLPDEYRDGEEAGLCPIQNGQGPGCLMDNFLYYGPRHGWYGHFCDVNDHNGNAPQPLTLLPKQSPKQSCQDLIDLFFQSRLTGDNKLNPPPEDGANDPTPTDPFGGVFKSLIESTAAYIRDAKEDGDAAGKPVAVGSLQTTAQKFLTEQIAYSQNQNKLNNPTAEQIKMGVAQAIKIANSVRTPKPDRFSADFVKKLARKADELANQFINDLSRPANGVANSANRSKSSDALQAKILTPLTNFAKDELGLNNKNLPSDVKGFSPEETSYLKQVASKVSSQTVGEDDSDFGSLLKAAKAHIQLSQIIARNSVDTADASGVPGTDIRRKAILTNEAQLKALGKLAIPGNPFSGFGLRRTLIIAPYPVDPNFDAMRLQSGGAVPYKDYRKIAIDEFKSLIKREQIVVLPEDMKDPTLLDVANDNNAERLRKVLRMIDYLNDQVRRGNADNIIFMIPPGGLSEDLGDQLEELRTRITTNPDTRIDVINIGDQGTQSIPRRLRDLSFRSQGSILLAADINDIGAIAQRLRGEGHAGSWVTIPQRLRIDLTPIYASKDDFGPQDSDVEAVFPRPVSSDREVSDRVTKKIELLFSLWRNQTSRTEDLQIKYRDRMESKENFGRFVYHRNIFLSTSKIVPSDGYSSPFMSLEPSNPSTWHSLDEIKDKIDELVKADGNDLNRQEKVDAAKKLRDRIDKLKDSLDDLYDEALNKEFTSSNERYKRLLQKTVAAKSQLMKSYYPPSEGEAGLTSPEDVLFRIPEFRNPVRDALTEYQKLSDEMRGVAGYYQIPIPDSQKTEEKIAQEKEVKQIYKNFYDLLVNLKPLLSNLYQLEALQSQPAPNPIKDKILEVVQGAENLYNLKPREKIQKSNDTIRRTNAETEKHNDEVFSTLARVASVPRPNKILLDLKRPERLYDPKAMEIIKDKNDPKAIDTIRLLDINISNRNKKIDQINKLIEELSRTIEENHSALPRIEPKESLQLYKLMTEIDVDRDKVSWISTTFHRVFAELLLELSWLEGELIQAVQDKPIYRRLSMPKPIQRIVEISFTPINATNPDPFKSYYSPEASAPQPIVFEPFTSEENADLDLIIGFSRPIDLDQVRKDPPKLRLKLDKDRQQSAPFLKLDEDKTTATMLVYRLPNPSRAAGRLDQGDFTPELTMLRKHLPDRGGQIDLTFSVASANSNILLSASLRQVQLRDNDGDDSNDPTVADRGVIVTSKSAAIIETLVQVGASVQDVDVTGYFQKIEPGNQAIDSPALTFKDDGRFPDLNKGDGVYTAKITLDPQERRMKADYRVHIQARSTEKTKFVKLGEDFGRPPADPDPKATTTSTTKAKKKKAPVDDPKDLPPVPKFQRATSINFQVDGEVATQK